MYDDDHVHFDYEHHGAMDFGSYGLGASVTPMGSQLVNANKAMNWGLNNLELTFQTGISFQQQGALAQLGKMERDEIIRLAKINQVNLSLHAPHFDAAGNTGQAFSEDARLTAVREFKNVIDFADQIGIQSKQMHVPIVIHGAEQTRASSDPETTMFVVNKLNGQMQALGAKEVTYDTDYLKKYDLRPGIDYKVMEGRKINNKQVIKILPLGELRLQNRHLVESINESLARSGYVENYTRKQIDEYDNALSSLEKQGKQNTEQYKMYIDESKRTRKELQALETQRATQEQELNYYKNLSKEGGILVPTEQFTTEKVINTIVDVATYAAEKKSMPRLAVENIFPEVVMGNPDQLAETITQAREKFAERMAPKVGKSQAKEMAKEIIGINFDIGHANLWKKYGTVPSWNQKEQRWDTVTADDAQIKKWAEKLQREGLLNHVHITDNWGDYDAHMPVGFGNAPIKEVMKMLRERGWGQGTNQRAIMETFGQVQYGGNAFGAPLSMYSMGTPLLSGGSDWEMAEGSYFQAGYPMTGFQTFPDINYQMYGVGFSGLPYATGANIPGKGDSSKFSDTPMS